MLEKVKNTLLNYVEIDPEDITPETEFLRDLKMNSYDIAAMIGELEDEFGIVMEQEALAGLVTVGDLAEYLSANT